MTLNGIARWAIRQSLGTKRGDELIAFLAMVDETDIRSAMDLLDTVRGRPIAEIVSDLRMLVAIDEIVQGDGYNVWKDGEQ